MRRAGPTILAALVVLAVASCAVFTPFISPNHPTADGESAGTHAGEEEQPASEERTATSSTPDASSPAQDPPPEPDPPDGNIGLRSLHAGTQSAIRVPVQTTVTNQRALDEVWASIHGNVIGATQPPVVNFDQETVIVLILGERPSAGYSVRAVSARQRGSTVEVDVRVTEPKPGMLTAAVLTSPYHVAAVEAHGKTFRFVGDDIHSGYDPL
jgi:hypothetical protein